MNTRTRVKVISFMLAGYVGLFGLVLKLNCQKEEYKRKLYYDYSESLVSLDENLENLSFSLQKSIYAYSPKVLSKIATEILDSTSSAKSNLANIPLSQEAYININKFLSQTGGFSTVLANNALEGKSLKTKELNTLKTLSKVAIKLSDTIKNGEIDYNHIKAFENLSVEENADSLNGLMTSLEDSLKGYPTLIYDGPYSDHILEKEPTLIKNMQEVSNETALQKAAKALDLQTKELKYIGEESGKMPCFKFEFPLGEVSVTKRGGVIASFLKQRDISTEKLSYEAAVEKAEDYLDKHTDYDFTSSYYFVENGVCTVNFAYEKEDVICYTDLIKVKVALDNGEVIGIEARGFIANHKERKDLTPKTSLKKAKEAINKDLKIIETNLCLIPKENANEVLAYEFVIKGSNDRDVIIYVNANTGTEEDVLILLKTDGGSLTK